jgi:small GTP-binding protein
MAGFFIQNLTNPLFPKLTRRPLKFNVVKMFLPRSPDSPPSLKIVLVGETEVGKTCILDRHLSHKFEGPKPSTVGTALRSAMVQTSDGPVRLHLWDTAGQERYASLASMYFRKAHVALLVFDLTRRPTFGALSKWAYQVKEDAPANIRIIVIGNKCDLDNKHEVVLEDVSHFRNQIGEEDYLETSAMTGDGVDLVFESIVKFRTDVPEKSVNRSVTVQEVAGGCC